MKNQRPRSFRVRRCEERTELSAHRGTKKRGTLGSDRIHDRPNIIHARLEVRQVSRTVGQTGTAFVEQDQSSDGGEAAIAIDVQGLFPSPHEVAEEIDEHEVEIALADYLVRDVYFAAAGVTDLRT